jgi:hypothetical protein
MLIVWQAVNAARTTLRNSPAFLIGIPSITGQ